MVVRVGARRIWLGAGVALACLFGPAGPGMPSLPPAMAEAAAAPSRALSRALMMADVMALLREEGLRNGAEIAADLPGGPDDPSWQQALARIYDGEAMLLAFDAAFDRALQDDGDAATEALAFFGSAAGQRILRLEIEARRALLDPAVEESAKVAYDRLAAANPDRVAALTRLVEVNDLIESNVMGALNSNLAFLRGMSQSDPALAMPEEEMLATVWAGEAESREETIDWMFPFLAMAYQPLSDAELDAYVAFSDSPAGQRVNAAMFKAFDEVFDDISFRLGREMGLRMTGQDI